MAGSSSSTPLLQEPHEDGSTAVNGRRYSKIITLKYRSVAGPSSSIPPSHEPHEDASTAGSEGTHSRSVADPSSITPPSQKSHSDSSTAVSRESHLNAAIAKYGTVAGPSSGIPQIHEPHEDTSTVVSEETHPRTVPRPSSSTPLLQQPHGDGSTAEGGESHLNVSTTNYGTLTLENNPENNPPQSTTTAQLTLFGAYAILVGSQIGAGIFSSPSEIDRNVPSPGAATIVWIVGGIIAWTGAASFAELGAAIPVNGGMQEYLGYIYNDFVASVMSWTWIVALKPSSQAILCITFAEYVTNVLLVTDKSVWVNKIIALATMGSMLLVNCVGSASSNNLTTVLLFTKLFSILLLIVLALLAITTHLNGDGQGTSDDWKSKSWFANRSVEDGGATVDWGVTSSWQLLGHYTTALYGALWGYSGWDHANLISGELRRPSRDLPWALNLALPTVIAAFSLANLSYYVILPWSSLHDNDAVAVSAGIKVLGPAGSVIFAFLVSAACLGSLNINVYVMGRLTVAAAGHGYIPRFLAGAPDEIEASSDQEAEERRQTAISRFRAYTANLTTKVFGDPASWNTPVRAMVFNTAVTTIYIVVGTFGTLVTLVELIECTFFFLTVFGGLLLRFREPSLPRPYQPPAFVPTIFCCATAFLVIRGVISSHGLGAILLSLIGLGALFQMCINQEAEPRSPRIPRSIRSSSDTSQSASGITANLLASLIPL